METTEDHLRNEAQTLVDECRKSDGSLNVSSLREVAYFLWQVENDREDGMPIDVRGDHRHRFLEPIGDFLRDGNVLNELLDQVEARL